MTDEEQIQAMEEAGMEEEAEQKPGGNRAMMFVGGAVAAGTLFELAGAGGVGLLLAGIVGTGMAYFSPELYATMERVLPKKAASVAKKSLEKRGIQGVNWRMLVARDYAPDTEPPLEEALLDEDEDEESINQSLPPLQPPSNAMPPLPLAQGHITHANTSMTLPLAENFVPDVDELIGEGIVVFGSKGSGKTNVGALLAEQFSRFYVPMVIFDVEGDYASIVQEVPHGYYGGAPLAQGQRRERYAALHEENAFQAGVSLLERGCQIVVDLSSYETDEQAAAIMVQMIAGMTAWANAQPPEERVPCLVFLDEAAYWLPQKAVSYLSKETQKVLLDTFHTLATKGRKRGLTPILLTQRISELEKSVMAQANVYFLGKQSLDNDLTRYEEYVNKSIATRDQIAAFGPGQFVVKLADGTQFITQFHERRSRHISHTPKARAALERYTRTQKRPTFHASSRPILPAMEPLVMRETPTGTTGTAGTIQEPVPVPAVPVTVPPRRLTDLERAVEAWNEGYASVNKLEEALGISHRQAYTLYQQMRERHLI